MKTRAVFPFDVLPTATVAPDPSARRAGTTYSLPAGAVIRAPVSCIATYVPPVSGGQGQLRLSPTSPLELTGKLPRWTTIGVDAFVLEGLDSVLASVADRVTKRTNGSVRKTIPTGQSSALPATPADWALGTQSVYLERGAKIAELTSSGMDLRLSVSVALAAVEILLDGDALLRAIDGAGGFASDAMPPAQFVFGASSSPLEGVGPTAAASATIEAIGCAATGVEVHGPPPAILGPMPADIAYLCPGAGSVTFTLGTGQVGTWSAIVSDQTALPASGASTNQFLVELPSGWWSPRGPGALSATVTVTLNDGSQLAATLLVLEHAPVSDSGRASRTDVPTGVGSPRVSILVSDLPPSAQVTTFGSWTVYDGVAPNVGVSVDGMPAIDITSSPPGDRLFFAAPAIATAGAYDITLTVGQTTATIPAGIGYTSDIAASLEGLKASLAVSAEEAALIAETFSGSGSDDLRMCAEVLRWRIGGFQSAVAAVGETLVPGDMVALGAWSALLTNEPTMIVDIVNGAFASLSSPPIASLDGQPVAGTDEEPDYDVAAFVIAMTTLDNVIVRSAHALGGN
jgi:hypothetical protein